MNKSDNYKQGYGAGYKAGTRRTETATNSSYEPPPWWNCQHTWVNVGRPVAFWTSTDTSEIQENAQIKQKQRCLVCGGYTWDYCS